MAYNGFSNYATWSIACVIDNNRSLYERFYGTAKVLRDGSDYETARDRLADEIEHYIEYAKENVPNPILSTLINIACADVDFIEVAENILDEIS